jgi:hypothetical protein
MQLQRMAIVVAASMCAANYGATEEVIEVHGCGVGAELIENGDAFRCIRHGGGGGNDHSGGWEGLGGGKDPGGPGGGQGSDSDSDPVPEEGGPPFKPWEEYVRQTNCRACKNSAKQCLDEASLGETTCINNATARAQQRCDFAGKYQDNKDGTVAAWGCSITDLRLGHCTEAEGWWGDESNWEINCNHSGGSMQCSGAGIDNCVASWALSHPGGSTTAVEGYGLSATFKGFGGTASQTFTTMFVLNAQTGFNKACSSAGDALVSGCTSAQLACYSEYSCTEADLQ